MDKTRTPFSIKRDQASFQAEMAWRTLKELAGFTGGSTFNAKRATERLEDAKTSLGKANALCNQLQFDIQASEAQKEFVGVGNKQ